jgi:two-component system OmpR family response regulator
MTILLVEDDPKLARAIARGLTEARHAVAHCDTGEAAIERLAAEPFDACILDVRLPGIDGFEVLRRSRAQGVTIPILMLTARDGVEDRVTGLNLGADDYLVKPFAFAELLARLNALLRRRTPPHGDVLKEGRLSLDSSARRVAIGGCEVSVSKKQFALLEFLLRHRGEVVSRAMLLEHVFEYKFDPGTNVVDVHVAHLRQIIDQPGEPSLIQTVRGVGYRVGRGDVV